MSKIHSAVIIDDNESLSYLIRDSINNTNTFEVVGIAHNGEDGIKLIESVKPDIVILDIIMPKVDGLAVLQHFSSRKDLFFIVLSALGHDLVTRRAVNLGAMYYLIKPFETNTLIERMESLILGMKQNKEYTINEDLIHRHISSEIEFIGVPMHVKGYTYIHDAVDLSLHEDFDGIKITKMIYPSIAEKHKTTSASVERAIRNAIEITLTRGDEMFLKHYFSHEFYNNKITNKEFIVRIAKAVKDKM